MLSENTDLYIYEVKGSLDSPAAAPHSFIGLWNEDDFNYLFFSSPEDDFVNTLLSRYDLTLAARHEMKYGDWQTAYAHGDIVIEGVKFSPPHSPSSDSIILDPSVVFGDGLHPTTRYCVRHVIRFLQTGRCTTMLDLGTGSGILALVAAHYGIGKVTAVDKNILAVATAKRNVALNGRESVIRVTEGEARFLLERPVDLVTANLPYSVLLDIVTFRGASLNRAWIVSGINMDQSRLLQGLFEDQDYVITDEQLDHPWLSFVAEKTMGDTT